MKMPEAEILFKEDCELRNYSKNTISRYMGNIRRLREVVENSLDNLDVEQIRYPMLRAFMVAMKKDGYGVESLNSWVTTLRTFFRFLEEEEVIPENVASKLRYGKAPTVFAKVLTTDEVLRLLSCRVPRSSDFETCRDQLLLELFYATGTRISEVVNLLWSNVDFQYRRITVVGKGNKERMIPYTDRVAEAFAAYREEWKRHIGEEFTGGVFSSRKAHTGRNKMCVRIARRILKERVEAAGLDKRVYPHLLRHTFATHLLENGAHMISVQKLMGHKNYQSTLRYEHVAMKNVYEDYAKCAPNPTAKSW